MNKKGFTLIELLAVIVILAIIALIATPAVLNIIEDSRKSAAEASTRNIFNMAEVYYMQELAKGNKLEIIDLTTNVIKYDGDKVVKGYVGYDNNGNASGKVYINGYCIIHKIDNSVESEKILEDECDTTFIQNEPTTYTKYNDGDYVLFDPTKNEKCETIVGSTTGTNDGCMKWYAFLDSESSSTVKLILDHNTTAKVAWNSDSTGTTPVTALAQLSSDVTNWNDAVKSTARLISAAEVNQIAPTTTDYTWNINDGNSIYYLHTGNQTLYQGDVGTNKYDWLFDNTNSCESYGCTKNDSNTYGYWTSNLVSSNTAWYVAYEGRLTVTISINAARAGIRPVITVNKSVFE